jgi:hypothetical protein
MQDDKGKGGDIEDSDLEEVSGAGDTEDDPAYLRDRGRDRNRTGTPPTRPAGGVQHPEKDYGPSDTTKKKLNW